jgi:Na+-translocating ferredoxin:NAD+ oxidoreductase RNF subunit RnfB
MMGLDPGRLRFLQKARQAGLGDFDISAIDLIGEFKRLPDYQLPPLGGEATMDNPALQDFLAERTRLRPQADPERCTGCETCVEQCPVSALSMKDDIPVVDSEICITCFCCQEICPEKAIALK